MGWPTEIFFHTILEMIFKHTKKLFCKQFRGSKSHESQLLMLDKKRILEIIINF